MASSSSPRASKPNLAEIAANEKAAARLGTIVSGRYRLVEVLAMGGVGVVYRGEHIHMRKWVAVKLLHPDAQDAPDLVARFQREAVAGAHIQHPNVAAATDFGELEDGAFFLVLEHVRGVTLRQIIRRGPMPVDRVLGIGRQIAAALGATHAMGIIHRDVTPRNLMVVEGDPDVVKLIDFGLAKLDSERLSTVASGRDFEEDLKLTGTGAVFGTIAYLAPEVARGMDAVDARADLYALGIVLYEMLSGKHPFDTVDAVELFKRHAVTKPPPIARRSPGVVVPPEVEAVVMRLLEKDPAARYASADELRAALDAVATDAITTPMPVPTPTPTPVTMSGPVTISGPISIAASAPARRSGAYAMAGVGALALLIGALWWSRSGSPAGAPSEASAPVEPAVQAASSAASAGVTPTAPPAPSVVATAASPAIQRVDPTARELLRAVGVSHDYPRAIAAFFALVDHDRAAFHEPLVATAARDLAVTIASAPGDDADRIFNALAEQLGSDGVDVLYELIRTRGGSRAAARAEALLQQSEVLARATPALQVTYALRSAPCPEKLALLDRAAEAGDIRTLSVLETSGKACFSRNQALDDATKSLRQRVGQRAAP